MGAKYPGLWTGEVDLNDVEPNPLYFEGASGRAASSAYAPI